MHAGLLPAQRPHEGYRRPLPSASAGSLRQYHAPVRLPLVLAVTLLAAPAAPAQETYTLNDGEQWELTGTPEPGSPEAQLANARRALADGQHARAVDLASAWLEHNKRHALVAEAHMVRGDALLAQREYYESLFDYEMVCRMYHGGTAFHDALARELEVATLFANGTRRKLWGMRIANAEGEAEELLIRVQERLPGSALAETAGMELADFFFRQRRMELATDAYMLFLENYPRSVQTPKAQRKLIYARLATFRGPPFDATGLDDARAELSQLKRADPAAAQRIGAEALVTRIDESEAQKLLGIAQWYITVDDPIAAEYTARSLITRYPRTAACIAALEHVIPSVLDLLPPSVRSEAPDYALLQRTILGREVASAEAAP